jgi:Domain of unknown function (DU1801)
VAKEKRQMQNVNFHSLDEFYDFLPADELKIVEFLRRIIMDCMPDCKEKLSYNVPYYFRHAAICFIWPGSVTWGSVAQKGVRLGFTSGYLLIDEIGYLDKGGRKQIYWKDYTSTQEIDTDLVRSYLYEAIIVDEEKAAARKKKKK